MTSKLSLFFAAILLFNACAVIERVGDFVNKNQLTAYLVVSQVTARYIDHGQDKVARANSVLEYTNLVEAQLDSDATTTADALVALIYDRVDIKSMSVPDQMLLKDLITVAQYELNIEAGKGELTPDTVLRLKDLLNTMRSSAAMFLK